VPLNIAQERRGSAGRSPVAVHDAARSSAPRKSVRHRVWEVLEPARTEDELSRRFDLFILTLIAANVAAMVLESVRPLRASFGAAFAIFEACSVLVFLAEYAARLWSCVEDPRSRGAVRGRLRWEIRPLSLVDLLVVAPFLMTLGTADARVLRVLRLFRLVCVLKAGRYLAALRLFRSVVQAKREELAMSIALTSVLLVVASSVMYFAEHEAQPDKFSSIPASMWWAVATLTTVGYGDVYPVTGLGRVAGGCLALLGVGLFALPTAILGSGLVEAAQSSRLPQACPHCGKPVR
jgi:voltage-gated potassium channel